MESEIQEVTALEPIQDTGSQLKEVAISKMSALQIMSDVATMARVESMAAMMAGSKITVPKHLQGNPGDCAAVIMQAMQWGMNPFAVAQKTHIVNNTLGYEAQLVNAVIMESGAIDGHFFYEYAGEGAGLSCRVGARVRGSQDITWGEWLSKADVTTQNSPLWKTNPKQQLGYLQVKNWARAFFPGAILGVYTPDELSSMEPKDINSSPARSRTGAATAQAAQQQSGTVYDPEQEERRAGLIKALEAFASKGVETFTTEWKKIGKASKQDIYLIGEAEYSRLLEMAVKADETKQPDTEFVDAIEEAEKAQQ